MIASYTGNGRGRLDLSASFSKLQFSRAMQLSFKKPYELAAKFAVRYYLTSRHTFVGLYGEFGFAWGVMSFEFQNPVEVDGRSISKDRLHAGS